MKRQQLSISPTAFKATTDIGLSSLEVPLQQCGKACQTFEQQIKISSRPTGTQTSLEDWARLLASYKMTVTIALIDANL
ncbi:hypothetical protein GGI35DRAFT_484911 [Trichoderma velutinum]